MRAHSIAACLACAAAFSVPASGAPTGLNTIPTTDLVPLHSWILQAQNGNTGLSGPPDLWAAPNLLLATQFALTSRIEAGVDWMQPPDLDHSALTFNAKALLLVEDEKRPGMAVGIWNAANRQTPGYFLTMSKTLNYEDQQRDRFRAHHRGSRKLLGRRIHAGLAFDGRQTFEPFAGMDLQISDNLVL